MGARDQGDTTAYRCAHRSLRRRIARRIVLAPLHWTVVLVVGMSIVVPVLCVLTWVPRGADMGLVGALLRVLWVVECVVASLMPAFALYALKFAPPAARPVVVTRQMRVSMLAAIAGSAATGICALAGRVDLAAYVLFGREAHSQATTMRRGLSGSGLAAFGLCLAAIAGVALRSAWVVAGVCLGLGLLRGWKWMARTCSTWLGGSLAGKPCRRQYVADARASCPIGGG